MPQTKPSENITITYEVSETTQNHQSAISTLSTTQQVSPLYCKNDPRLIVYEPKHPLTKPLQDQSKDATKEWIIFKFTQAMTMIDIVNKRNMVNNNSISQDRESLTSINNRSTDKK